MFSGFISFLLSLLFLLISSPGAQAETFTLTDATGRETTISIPAKRIVSLAPSVTEVLFALGLDSEIIGVTEICNFPDKAKKKHRIGGASNPSLEEILSLKPDLVLAVDGVTGSVGIDELRRVGLPVVTLKPRMIDSLVREIRLIGRLTDRKPAAEKLAGQITQKIGELEKLTRDQESVSVLYLIWHDPMMTVGPDTFIGEIITKAGGKMIGKELGLGYFRLGMESVLLFDPQVIIIGDEIGADQFQSQMNFWNRWQEIRAVRDKRVHFIDADLIHRPGPRIFMGMETIGKLLHPGMYP